MKQHLPTSRCNTWPPLDPAEKWETYCCWWQQPESWPCQKNFLSKNKLFFWKLWLATLWLTSVWWHKSQFDDRLSLTGRTNPEMSKIGGRLGRMTFLPVMTGVAWLQKVPVVLYYCVTDSTVGPQCGALVLSTSMERSTVGAEQWSNTVQGAITQKSVSLTRLFKYLWVNLI